MNEEKLFFIKGPIVKDINPKKRPRPNGIITTEKGIKILKFSSKVRELDIQWVLDRKKPIPKK